MIIQSQICLLAIGFFLFFKQLFRFSAISSIGMMRLNKAGPL